VVDKQRLNKVAIIRRLFPMRGSCCRCAIPVMSCSAVTSPTSVPNSAMANFLDLDDAAALYDLTFAHWEKARALFDLPVATVVL
jgi:hypothetical protein